MSRLFSPRVPPSLAPNRVTVELARRRAASAPLVDLTVTNPTTVGLDYPPDLLADLGARASLVYRPDPFGSPRAREAVADRIEARRGRRPSIDRLALTASTSEAYSLIFKLLCAAGDEVLVPQPSYPLFEHLAALDLVRPVPYRLEYHGRWSIDLSSLDAAWTPRTRAVIVVSPNNPTGSFLRQSDSQAVFHRCEARQAALIVDEVFADYPLGPGPDACRDVLGGDTPPALAFALDGLSKACGLPQLKLGWMEFDGPADLVIEARTRLELVLDTYLSVNTPAQLALPKILGASGAITRAIRERVVENWRTAVDLVRSAPACDLLPLEAGWSAVLRVPATVPEEERVLGLLREDGVLVHPGYFFDFPHEAFLVLSLLPQCDVFRDGFTRVVRRLATA